MSYLNAPGVQRPKRPPRELWADGKSALGCFLMIPSALSAEIVASAGYEWVCVDTQHGLIGHETMVTMVQALNDRVATLIRVAWNEPHLIMQALDSGADGVIVPMVNTSEEAAAAVRACHYPPRGIRSFAPIRNRLGQPDLTPELEDEKAFCAVMIETAQALDNLGEIAAVDGLDALFVGPSDLSISALGGLVPAGATPDSTRALESVLVAARTRNLITGLAVSGSRWGARWRDAGYQMVAIHNDAGLLAEAAWNHLDAARPPDVQQ
jgi:4-hydroxy-2-oxoheptanedioate aldolase